MADSSKKSSTKTPSPGMRKTPDINAVNAICAQKQAIDHWSKNKSNFVDLTQPESKPSPEELKMKQKKQKELPRNAKQGLRETKEQGRNIGSL